MKQAAGIILAAVLALALYFLASPCHIGRLLDWPACSPQLEELRQRLDRTLKPSPIPN